MHRAPQCHRFGCHWGVHRQHHLQGVVHELGRKSPTKASELLDITTNLAMGKEVVRAIFPDAKGKRKVDAAEVSASRDPKKKKGRPGKQKRQKDTLVATTDRKNPRGPHLGPWEFLTKCSRSHAPIIGTRRSTPWRSAP
jgi:hypothetical protein